MTTPQQGFEYPGTGGDEELEPDLEPGAGVVQAIDENGGRGGVGHIQGDDEASARDLSGIAE